MAGFKRTSGWILCSLIWLAGCASNEVYRHDFEECTVSDSNSCDSFAVQRYGSGSNEEYLLAFIEIDDQGQLRDRAQFNIVLDTLYKMASEDSLLINLFIHGWHHNAAPGDPNIESFKQGLARLSGTESFLSEKDSNRLRPKRKVVGIYLGWRGESITVPGINNITFWDRKNTAQEVGHLGVTETLLRLEEISRVRNSLQPPIKSRLITIGHSFGGAAVFAATSQILADRFVNSRAGKSFVDDADGFGDLVVLLNPAFEALLYAPLYDLAQYRCSYFSTQKPRLVILTSETDYATKLAFPAGRMFTTFFETHDDVERNACKKWALTLREGEADRSAVGHFDDLVSHTLMPADGETGISVVERGNVTDIWNSLDQGGAIKVGSTVLTHLNRTHVLNPYMNVRVDTKLIADHNDVFGKDVWEFIRMLILLSTTDGSETDKHCDKQYQECKAQPEIPVETDGS